MFEIKALRQKKADLLAKMKALATTAKAEKRDLTETETATYDADMLAMKACDADIARVEALMEAERTAPAAGTAARADLSEAGKKGFNNLGEMMISAHAFATKGKNDDRLYAAAQGSNEAVDAEGGFLVAPEVAKTLVQRTYDTGILASRTFGMPMASNRLILNAVDEDSRADGQRWGGIQAYWQAEASQYTGTKPKFREMQLTANKLIGLCFATEEQLDDAPALEAYVTAAFPDEFAFKLDDAIYNGPGAGIPLGVLSSGCAYQVAKDAGQAAKTISATNVLNMWSHLFARSRKTAAWFINQDAEPQLYPLALANPTGAVLFQGPMYTPPGQNGNTSDYGLLMGKPVIPIEQAATVGTPGDLVLADFSQYILGKKGGIRADSSIHVAFLTGEQAFRFMLRVDGQPMWKKPLTPKNGTNLLSPFVTLQAR